MDAIVKVEGITKHYKEFSLDHVSFQVPRGMILGLIGENGAGKSTTISALLDLISLDEGNIEIFGQSHEKTARKAKERMGVIIDGLDPYLMYYPKDVEKIMSRMFPGRWDGELFKRYMDRFNLPGEKRIKDYSKGMRVKFNFAAALSHRPELMILDEATSGLDPVMRDEILEILQEFLEDENHAVLMSTHITSDLDKIADHIVLLHEGRVMFQKTKEELDLNYGVLHCGKETFEALNEEDVEAYIRGDYEYRVLVNNRRELQEHIRDLAIDRASIEDIMLFYIKGERI